MPRGTGADGGGVSGQPNDERRPGKDKTGKKNNGKNNERERAFKFNTGRAELWDRHGARQTRVRKTHHNNSNSKGTNATERRQTEEEEENVDEDMEEEEEDENVEEEKKFQMKTFYRNPRI